ncbi:group 1 truncated hemoglobin [Mitsuaria sp. GD03876]|uniref:group I truncated hemoglobin n=1 Tax=Mitsuaria sp. GD03876 TaxID=2975399 RepID=UPI0024490019|nr:group 1 truncated hemoglobin [Mitsuaria sp. GD03876]MDH0864082.1 group 1 truncated hemoglobin [Mitsuaria sp. GD03876]
MRSRRITAATAAWLRAGLLATALGAGVGAWAADDALHRALGGDEGIARIVNGMVDRAYADPRIQKKFDGVNPKALKESLSNQFCVLAGGSCRYEGETMKNAHAHLALDKADFNALVEDLQLSMDEQRVPFTVQNRLLALLAPMHRDIITKR